MLVPWSTVAAVDLAWHPHISVWLVMGALIGGYWYALAQWGPRLLGLGVLGPGVPVATRREKTWLVAGLGSMWLFAESPIHDMAEKYLFSVHMLQHTVFTLIAPACLLLGTPAWLQRKILAVPPIGAFVRVMARPLIALVVFNAMIAGTHFPQVVEKSLRNEFVHFGLHGALFVTATMMWFPVINRINGYPMMKAPLKMMYVFGQSIVPTVPASFLTISSTALYDTYAKAPRLIAGFDAVEDQQIAAAIMKIGAGMLLWTIIGYLFFKMANDAKRGLSEDNLRTVPTPATAAGPIVGSVLADRLEGSLQV